MIPKALHGQVRALKKSLMHLNLVENERMAIDPTFREFLENFYSSSNEGLARDWGFDLRPWQTRVTQFN